MSRKWNGKALVDEIAARLWDTSSGFRVRILEWCQEIQDDIATHIPQEYFKFRLKKLLPTDQEIISLKIQKPTTPSVALGSGGSLVENSVYKVYTSFLVYDQDLDIYMESEPSVASSELTATASDKTISVSSIDTLDGDTTVSPTNIYRRIYLSVKASGETSFGEPFFIADIEDNTTTVYSITAESSSTVTPPSDSELDQISEDLPFFVSSNRYLTRESKNTIRRFDPDSSTSTTPDIFDYMGTDRIVLYPKLDAASTTAQRTLVYHVYRRPHEIFYDDSLKIDLPIIFKKALIEGVIWKGYEYRDREGAQGKLANYEEFRRQAINKITRQKGRPNTVLDVNGDTFGMSIH